MVRDFEGSKANENRHVWRLDINHEYRNKLPFLEIFAVHQVEHFALHMNRDGTIFYGMHMDAIVDRCF